MNTLVLNLDSFAVSQAIIADNEAVSESVITVVNSQTWKVTVSINEDFFVTIPAPQSIELIGFATVKDISSTETTSASLLTQFVLELNYVANVSSPAVYVPNKLAFHSLQSHQYVDFS